MDADWALDVSQYPEVLAWVPVDLDSGIVTWGMTLISDRPPGRAVALVSMRGSEHVDEVSERFEAELNELFERVNA